MSLFSFGKKTVKDDLVEESIVTKKGLSKGAKFGLIFGGLLLIIVLVKLLAPKDTSLNYFDAIGGIFSNELGTFRYTFDIRTGDKDTLIASDNQEVAELEDIESSSSSDGLLQDTKFEFSDWGESSQTVLPSWEHPCYRVTIDGCTTALDPLETQFTIGLATQYNNDVFTDVTCINGAYYINIESMRNWLIHSRDAYLIELGNQIPLGFKYLVVLEDEFAAVSRYAEDGELEFSKYTGLVTMYRRFLTTMLSIKDVAKNNITSGITANEDTAVIKLEGDSAVCVLQAAKGLVDKTGDFYQSTLEKAKTSGLYNDVQYIQALREKDNVMNALSGVSVFLNTTDFKSLMPKFIGSARKLNSASGSTILEGNLLFSMKTETRDVIVQFAGRRSGTRGTIMLPQGSQTSIPKLESPTLISDLCHGVMDYFNVTNVKLANKLEITPKHIADNAVTDFIALVNSVGSSEYYVTKHNVNDFIETYANMKLDTNTTENMLKNKQLVTDYLNEINALAGGVVIEREILVNDTTERYPDVHFFDGDLEYIISFNEDLSDAKMMTLTGIAINNGTEAISVDTTDFQVKTLLNSVYPANNEILIRNYNNMFDLDKLVVSFDLEPGAYRKFTLNIVLSDDLGHMDLFYKKEQKGAIIQY